jgi:GGDEF domain-containing protein
MTDPPQITDELFTRTVFPWSSRATTGDREHQGRSPQYTGASAGHRVCRRDLLSLSVGTSVYPQDGLDAEQLLAEADKKMYAVKELHHQHPETAALPG